jgi:hypothetical protein
MAYDTRLQTAMACMSLSEGPAGQARLRALLRRLLLACAGYTILCRADLATDPCCRCTHYCRSAAMRVLHTHLQFLLCNSLNLTLVVQRSHHLQAHKQLCNVVDFNFMLAAHQHMHCCLVGSLATSEQLCRSCQLVSC